MICPNCKNTIDDDSRFCRFCGAEFIAEDEAEEAKPDYEILPELPSAAFAAKKQGSRTARLKLVVTICVIAAACLVLTVVLLSSGAIGAVTGNGVTDISGDKVYQGIGKTEMTVMDSDGNVKEIITDRALVTAEAILKEYTSVMNQLKEGSAGFTKLRYQNLPTEHQNLGSLGKLVLPIIERYVTSKQAAQPSVFTAGNADKLPVVNSQSGCLLTDATKIKNAYCEVLENGDYKLVLTLVQETNPEILPAGATESGSAVSAVFDPYDAAEQINAISSLALSNIDFNYTDCTAELIYSKSSKKVVSLTQTMNIDVSANAHIATINARIVDITEFTDFVY